MTSFKKTTKKVKLIFDEVASGPIGLIKFKSSQFLCGLI
jgi:hypothetical protein